VTKGSLLSVDMEGRGKWGGRSRGVKKDMQVLEMWGPVLTGKGAGLTADRGTDLNFLGNAEIGQREGEQRLLTIRFTSPKAKKMSESRANYRGRRKKFGAGPKRRVKTRAQSKSLRESSGWDSGDGPNVQTMSNGNREKSMLGGTKRNCGGQNVLDDHRI